MTQYSDRTTPTTNAIIKEEGDVLIIEEDVANEYPIFKWDNRLKRLWVLLLIIKLTQIERDSIKTIMDFVVTGVETANTRQQVQDQATKTSPELRRIMKSATDEVVQGTHIIDPMGQKIQLCC